MAQLEPLAADLSEAKRALAEALRTLFKALNLSMGRYAVRCGTDKGTLSRYLSGARVPPWSFIMLLLEHVSEVKGQPANEDAVALLRDLYIRAAGTGSARRSQDLQFLLEEADQQAREAASLEKVLRNAVHDLQQQVNHLNVEINTLRAARAAERQAVGAEVERFSRDTEDLKSERDSLAQEVEILRGQLREAIKARELAEEKCDQLERQLEQAESREAEEEQNNTEKERQAAKEDERSAESSYGDVQTKIALLEMQLLNLREATRPPEPPPAYLLDAEKDGDTGSRAARRGYSPGETLRRVDAAQKDKPRNVRKVLSRAVELQTPAEIIVTRALLRGMPAAVRDLFEALVLLPAPAPTDDDGANSPQVNETETTAAEL
ncbi:helix-turn-helix domain-containing protein [Streptomyces arenae]|uniref:helix-turn-helix domain-containing protein n=1 Tax=Streptomyces arenae TaxID=29301 RepID=UPI0026584240|nr:hypothetical protein [Streptomyces arenae]MCG7209901.1 hypothetical protein [Streptomyces arenae]